MIDFMIRADASKRIGWGHVTRCLSLGQILVREHGYEVALVSRYLPFKLKQRAQDYGIHVMELGGSLSDPVHEESDAYKTVGLLERFSCRALLVDHYELTGLWQALVRSKLDLLVAMDDLMAWENKADLIVNGALFAREFEGAKSLEKDGRGLFGPKYSLLDPAFALFRQEVQSVDFGARLKNLVVNFGATDVKNFLSLSIMALLTEFGPKLNITSFLGDADAKQRVLDHVPEHLHPQLDLVVGGSSQEIATSLASADLYVGAGGVSSLEACVVGLPQILYTVAANQAMQVTALASQGAALCVPTGDIFVSTQSLVRLVRKLDRAPSMRRQMSGKARRLYDGLGVYRVANQISDRMSVKPQSIPMSGLAG